MTMMLNRWDTPLTQGKSAPLAFIEPARPAPAERPRSKIRPHERFAMSWRNLCVTTGKKQSTWWYQVHRYGMSELEALKTRREYQPRVVMTMADLCARVGTPITTFEFRRRRGDSFREALLGRES